MRLSSYARISIFALFASLALLTSINSASAAVTATMDGNELNIVLDAENDTATITSDGTNIEVNGEDIDLIANVQSLDIDGSADINQTLIISTNFQFTSDLFNGRAPSLSSLDIADTIESTVMDSSGIRFDDTDGDFFFRSEDITLTQDTYIEGPNTTISSNINGAHDLIIESEDGYSLTVSGNIGNVTPTSTTSLSSEDLTVSGNIESDGGITFFGENLFSLAGSHSGSFVRYSSNSTIELIGNLTTTVSEFSAFSEDVTTTGDIYSMTFDGTGVHDVTVSLSSEITPIRVVSGQLQLGSASTFGSGDSQVIIEDGGKLIGTGSNTGDLSLEAGASIRMGASTGRYLAGDGTGDDSVTIAPGAFVETFVEDASESPLRYGRLEAIGTVDITDSFLNVSGTYTPSVGDDFIIIVNDGVDPIVGTFSGLAEGALTVLNGVALQISYIGGDGNDVVLTAVVDAPPAEPTITTGNISITGATGTGGVFRIGDVMTATWDNSATGDNNAGIDRVEVDFSAFRSGFSLIIPAENNGSDLWIADFPISEGSIDIVNQRVTVTAFGSSGASDSLQSSPVIDVDNIPPTFSGVNAITDFVISTDNDPTSIAQVGDGITATAGSISTPDGDTITWDASEFGGSATQASASEVTVRVQIKVNSLSES